MHKKHIESRSIYIYVRLSLLLVVYLILFPSTSFCIPKYRVRVIHFKTADAPAMPNQKLRDMLRESQEIYLSAMIDEGYNAKTYQYEEDRSGKIVTHVVNGKHNFAHYMQGDLYQNINRELPFEFNNDMNIDSRDNIHIILLKGIGQAWDNRSEGVGWPWINGRYGGNTIIIEDIIDTSPDLLRRIIIHELGHAFGLYHNRIDDSLMGPKKDVPDGIGDMASYESGWLNRHRFFTDINVNFSEVRISQEFSVKSDGENNIEITFTAESNTKLSQSYLAKGDEILNGKKLKDFKETFSIAIPRLIVSDHDDLWLAAMNFNGDTIFHDFNIGILPDLDESEVRTDINKDIISISVLMYTGNVSWVSIDDAKHQSETAKQMLASIGVISEITKDQNYVRDWMVKTTSDGKTNVLITYGVLPSSVYPSRNKLPDNSIAEKWIESTDGDAIINHGDYFGFVGGNGIVGLQSLMDIPGILMWDFGLENNTPMIVTADGKSITPSLTNFKSDRAFHLDKLDGNWFAEKVFASTTGTSHANRADPVIVRDGNLGRIGIVFQTFNEVNPKGKVVAEIIGNFILQENNKDPKPNKNPDLNMNTDTMDRDKGEPISISPNGKLTTKWASLKARK